MSDRSLDMFPGNEGQPTDQDKADIGLRTLEGEEGGEASTSNVTSPVAVEAKGRDDTDTQVAVAGSETKPVQDKETAADPEGTDPRKQQNILNQTTATVESIVEAKPANTKIEDPKEEGVASGSNTEQELPAPNETPLHQPDDDMEVEGAEIPQRVKKTSSPLQTAPSDEDTLALDVLPTSDDIEVANYNDLLKETLKLQQYTQTVMVVARYLYIATLALATDARYLTKAQELLFTSLKLCDKTGLMLQSFQSGANNILEKLKVAYLYCMDGFEDFARTDIEATKKDVETMRQAVQKTKGVLGNLRSNITEVRKSVVEESAKLEGVVMAPASATAHGDQEQEALPPQESSYRFRNCKGDKELIEERAKRNRPIVDIDIENTEPKQVQPCNSIWIFLILATLAASTVVLHIVAEYVSLWPGINDIYPPTLIATFASLGLLFLYLGIFDACIAPFEFGKYSYLNLFIVLISMVLVYLQILDCLYKWWSTANNNWISFPIVVLLLILDAMCLKLLCQCGGPDVYPNHIASIINARRKSGEGGRRGDVRDTTERDGGRGSAGDTDFDEIERKSIQLKYGRFKLTEAVLLEAASNLGVASGLLDALVPVVEGWSKECVDILEPAMKQGITMTESMSAEKKKQYWNSVVFKTEVTSYYCRWRALQVYCEKTRPKLATARQRIEAFYTDNLYPRDAVESAWKMAAEETVPEIRHLVAQFSGNPADPTTNVVNE